MPLRFLLTIIWHTACRCIIARSLGNWPSSLKLTSGSLISVQYSYRFLLTITSPWLTDFSWMPLTISTNNYLTYRMPLHHRFEFGLRQSDLKPSPWVHEFGLRQSDLKSSPWVQKKELRVRLTSGSLISVVNILSFLLAIIWHIACHCIIVLSLVWDLKHAVASSLWVRVQNSGLDWLLVHWFQLNALNDSY